MWAQAHRLQVGRFRIAKDSQWIIKGFPRQIALDKWPPEANFPETGLIYSGLWRMLDVALFGRSAPLTEIQLGQGTSPMIRLSRLADYAVLLMSRMANTPDRVHNAVDIAEATGLPAPTVCKLLATLAREGLLKSVRGAKGGYGLAMPAREISVAKIIAAIDGPIAITHCIEHPGSCDVETLCPSRYGWQAINRAVQQALEGVSLSEISRSLPPAPFAPAQIPTTQLAAAPDDQGAVKADRSVV
jgi:FeS assembly SUF system regulator